MLYFRKLFRKRAIALNQSRRNVSKAKCGPCLLCHRNPRQRFPIKNTDGLNQVEWKGRWQKLKLNRQTLILDSTHNTEACLQLEENLSKHIAKSGKKPIIVTGILGNERAQDIMPLLSQNAHSLYLVEPKQPRSCSPETLVSLIPKSQNTPTFSSRLENLFSKDCCHIGDENDTILITGSIYLMPKS